MTHDPKQIPRPAQREERFCLLLSPDLSDGLRTLQFALNQPGEEFVSRGALLRGLLRDALHKWRQTGRVPVRTSTRHSDPRPLIVEHAPQRRSFPKERETVRPSPEVA